MNNNINDEKICACVRVQPILSMGRRDFEISNISSGRPKLETRILNIRVGAHRPKALDTFFSNVFNYKRQNWIKKPNPNSIETDSGDWPTQCYLTQGRISPPPPVTEI